MVFKDSMIVTQYSVTRQSTYNHMKFGITSLIHVYPGMFHQFQLLLLPNEGL